ncbi:Transducin family protein / WD-40 repeat family protein [Balamuthia mandrillaris]
MENGGSSSAMNGLVSGTNSKGYKCHPLIRKEDYVRLIIQALHDLGYSQSAQLLSKESLIELQSKAVTEFCADILHGRWSKASSLLSQIISNKQDLASAHFLIYEQEYLELLEKGNVQQALQCLRTRIAPLNCNHLRLTKLSTLVMFTDKEELYHRLNWDGVNGSSRHNLLRQLRQFISADVLLPERRLETLVVQALELQKGTCLHHNTTDNSISLFEDHFCPRDKIPSKAKHELKQHTDEVWFLQFSHGGKFLASASRDKTAIIWILEEDTVRPLHILSGHEKSTWYLSWSPDDRLLLTSGLNDSTVRLWDVETGTLMHSFQKHTDAITACAWMPDGNFFVTGGLDRQVYVWNVQGEFVKSYDIASSEINDLAISPDGKWLVLVCQEMHLIVLDLETDQKFTLPETEAITSISISEDSMHVLVNISTREIHLWNLLSRMMVQKYEGQQQGRFVIRSCFGGANQAFILSGSEDNKVYIWNREHGTLLYALEGHEGTVNCVSWNPTNPYQFASASDDHTIRIWESERSQQYLNELLSSSNSNTVQQQTPKKRRKGENNNNGNSSHHHMLRSCEEKDKQKEVENGSNSSGALSLEKTTS